MNDSNQIILFCFFGLLIVFGYVLKKLRPNYFDRLNGFFGGRLQPNKLGPYRGYDGNRSWVFKRLAIFFVVFFVGMLLLYFIMDGFRG